MKKLLLLLFITILYYTVSAQQPAWFPKGAKWTYSMHYYFPEVILPIHIYCTGDTVILGKSCSILNADEITCAGIMRKFVYEENDTVFHFDTISNSFFILYDFTKQPGEKWKTVTRDFNHSQIDTIEQQVDSVKTITMGAFPVRVLYAHNTSSPYPYPNYGFYNYVFVEYFGETGYIFPQWSTCDPYPVPIRCYHDSIFGDLNFVPVKPLWWRGQWDTDATDCEYHIIPGIEEFQNDKIQISPNPASSSITLSMPRLEDDATLQVFNSIGTEVLKRKICRNETSVSLDVSALPAGMYLLRMSDARCRIYTGEFLKQ